VEEIHLAVAAIEHVIITINFDGASGTGHAQRLAIVAGWVNKE
jgi:cell division GTPase FtsZ